MKNLYSPQPHPNLYLNQKRQGERRREIIQLMAFAGASLGSMVALVIFAIIARPALSIGSVWPLVVLVIPPAVLLFGIMRVLMHPITSWDGFMDQVRNELMESQLIEKSVQIFTKSLQTLAFLLVSAYTAFFFLWAVIFGGILRIGVTAGLPSAFVVTLIVAIIIALLFKFGGPLIRIIKGFVSEGGPTRYVATHPRQFT